MTKIVVATDGSDNSVRAAEYIVRHYQNRDNLYVAILNVQPPLHSSHARMFINKEDLSNYYFDEGQKDMQKLADVLDQAGIEYEKKIEVGSPAEKIAEFASEMDCDVILMGTKGHGLIKNMVLGSTSTKVIHLSEIPVTLVK